MAASQVGKARAKPECHAVVFTTMAADQLGHVNTQQPSNFGKVLSVIVHRDFDALARHQFLLTQLERIDMAAQRNGAGLPSVKLDQDGTCGGHQFSHANRHLGSQRSQ